MATTLIIKNARVAFVNVFDTDNYGRYSLTAIIDPSDRETVAAIEDAIRREAKEKWGDKAEAVLSKLYSEDKVAFSKKEKTDRDGNTYDGFEGRFYIAANNKSRPTVVDRDRTPLVAADGRPYAGCYCNLKIEFWAQESSEWGRRVNCSLLGVQFVKDGDAFSGGRVASPDDFDDLSAGADDETLA
jgi:hypothetical protein